MQPQNETEECDAMDLLSCLTWKIIFMLQATSYSNFWNNWIPGRGGGGAVEITMMFFNITLVITLKYNSKTL